MASQTLVQNSDRCANNIILYHDLTSDQWSLLPWVSALCKQGGSMVAAAPLAWARRPAWVLTGGWQVAAAARAQGVGAGAWQGEGGRRPGLASCCCSPAAHSPPAPQDLEMSFGTAADDYSGSPLYCDRKLHPQV